MVALRDPCTHHQGSGAGLPADTGCSCGWYRRDVRAPRASHVLCVSPTPRLGRTPQRCPTPLLCLQSGLAPAAPSFPKSESLRPAPGLCSLLLPLVSPLIPPGPEYACTPNPPTHKGPRLFSLSRLQIPASVSPLSAVDLVTGHICL